MTTLPDKFTATVPGHAYVKYLTAERKDWGDYTVTWFYDQDHPDFALSNVPATTAKRTLTTSVRAVEGWLESSEWVIQKALAEEFTVEVPHTGRQYVIKRREDGDFDMHSTVSWDVWLRTEVEVQNALDRGWWAIIQPEAVEAPQRHELITVDGILYYSPIEVVEAFRTARTAYIEARRNLVYSSTA